jgi:uncharacterized membrane protein (UPF0127 family)
VTRSLAVVAASSGLAALGSIGAVAVGSGCDDDCERWVLGQDEAHVAVCVTRATTADERRRGLVGRGLDDGEGLLLVFPFEGEVCITNEGVGLAIDILWLDARGTITAIERAVAAGAPGPWCHAPAAFVLELRAGAAAAVAPGDRHED